MKGSFIGWLSEYFRREDPGENMSVVTGLFCDESSKEELREFLSAQFNEIMSDKNSQERDLDHILYKIHYNINMSGSKTRPGRISIFLKWSYRAASVIILFVLVFWGARGYLKYNKYNELGDSFVEIHSPAWTRTSFTLPDGSTGWLNSNSRLKYRMNFSTNRHVELAGEAFFDVESDSKRPFSVDAGDISVTVHGTRFNIAAWKDEDITEVVLEEGEIEVMEKNSDSSFMLKPGELALYDRFGKSFVTEVVESHKYLSWTEGRLVFRNDPIEVIERRIERWYNVDVEVVGSFEDDFRLRATFVNESLEEVLGILKRSLNIGFSIEDQGINAYDTYGKRQVKIYME